MAYTIRLAIAREVGHLVHEIRQAVEAQHFSIGEVRIEGHTLELKRIRKTFKQSVTSLPTLDEWKVFNATINRVLDKEKVIADVWSTPFDVKGRFWIRRGEKAVTA